MHHQDTRDFRDQLTVFVTTVGSPTFETCLTRLHEQDCAFSLKIIDRVAPMSAALQRMLDDCTTPFFVQVDEDMLLYPHAVRTLYRRLVAMEPEVVQYVCALYDVHLDRVIYGLKINRHEVVSRYPYRNVRGCEWDQIGRFRADGFVDVRAPLEGATKDSENTLGLHGTHWDPQTIYLRFRVLEIKRRLGNRTHDWVVETAQMLIRRYLEQESDLDFFALMGILGGVVREGDEEGTEKDFRRYSSTPGLGPAKRFLEEVRKVGDPAEE
jgi:hypothetical protein